MREKNLQMLSQLSNNSELVEKIRRIDAMIKYIDAGWLKLLQAYDAAKRFGGFAGTCRGNKIVYFKHPDFDVKSKRLVFYRFVNGKFDGIVNAVVKYSPCDSDMCDPDTHCYDNVVDPKYDVAIGCLGVNDMDFYIPVNVDCVKLFDAVYAVHEERGRRLTAMLDEVLDMVGYKTKCRGFEAVGTDGTTPSDFNPWGRPGVFIHFVQQISRPAAYQLYKRAQERSKRCV